MDLSLSEEQRLIVETAEGFLADASSSAAMRAAAASEHGIDPLLWRGIQGLGWCGVHLPESHGGLGLGWRELMLLQEQMGRRLACVPFFDSVVLAGTALLQVTDGASAGAPDHAARSRWLSGVADGSLTATVALAPLRADSAAAECATGCRVESSAEGWRLMGDWPQIGSAALADLLLLPAHKADGELALFAVPRASAGLVVRPLHSIDTTRRCADVSAKDLRLLPEACIAAGPALLAALVRTRRLAAIALAAEQLGVAQQCLDLTLAYTLQRVQFDKPIASFQAVKHRCAQMMVAVVGARSAVYGAACVADDADASEDELMFHAALAHCEATEAALFCAREAIQLHGGVGFTWEYDPHLYFKRAQAASQRLGPLSAWREHVAAQFLDAHHMTPDSAR